MSDKDRRRGTVADEKHKAEQKAKNHHMSRMAEMMTDKHTKGPWKIDTIEGYDPCTEVVNDDGEIICDNETFYPAAVSVPDMILIAAAPDMLEALELALEWNFKNDFSNGLPEKYWAPEFKEFHDKLKAVIAKAKGLDG